MQEPHLKGGSGALRCRGRDDLNFLLTLVLPARALHVALGTNLRPVEPRARIGGSSLSGMTLQPPVGRAGKVLGCFWEVQGPRCFLWLPPAGWGSRLRNQSRLALAPAAVEKETEAAVGRMPPRRSDSVAFCLLRSLIRQEPGLLAPASLTSGAQHLQTLALCLHWPEHGARSRSTPEPLIETHVWAGLAEGNIVKSAQVP